MGLAERTSADGALAQSAARRRAGSALAALAIGLLAALATAPRADAFVYWANNNSIGRANLNGSGASQSFVANAGGQGLAVDAGHLYWSDVGAIGRADLDGSSPNHSFVTGASGPLGVAVDAVHVYWVNFFTSTIGRAPLSNPNGLDKDQTFIENTNQTRGVAVDPAHVYWTNLLDNSEIGRANINGTGATNSFLPASFPTAVAVDEAHVYWANNNTGMIGRADLDGSNPDQEFIVTDSTDLEGVAVDAAHVYWTDTAGDKIGRANLDGTSPNQRFITGAIGPRGIAVDGLSVPSCQSSSSSTEVATPVRLALSCSSGGGRRSFSIESQPAHGEISGFSSAGGTLTYTPNPGFFGTDSFRFRASNPGATSATATATIEVAPASNEFTVGVTERNKRKGTATLPVNVPGAGVLELAGAKVKSHEAQADAAGEVTLPVKARGKARKKLRKKGKARVTAEITFTPEAGEPKTESTSVKLRRIR